MEQEHPKTQLHPEWKILYATLRGVLDVGQTWTYQQLSEIARMDITSTRGRQQFYRFSQEVSETLDLWFECEHKVGYRIILPKDHVVASLGKVRQARRKIKQAVCVVSHVRLNQLTPEERAYNADTLVRVSRLHQDIVQEYKAVAKGGTSRGEAPPKLLLGHAIQGQQ